MTSSIATRSLCAVLLSLAGSACAKDDESGTLSVEYRLGAGVACDSASLGIGGLGVISTVRATLIRGGTETTEEAPCEEGGTILFPSVSTGNYDLLVEGVDAAGDTVMDNLVDNAGGACEAPCQKAEVIGGTSQTVPTELVPTPATIQARFNITKDGSFAQCMFADVQYFDVTAFRNGTQMLASQFDYCTTPPSYSTLPDPMRRVEGAELNIIRVDVLDSSSNEVATLPLFEFDPPGAGKLVQITISCDNTDCSGTLDVVGGGPVGDGDGGGGTAGGTGGGDDGDAPPATGGTTGAGDSTGG